MGDINGVLPGLPAICGKPVHIAFDGGQLTSVSVGGRYHASRGHMAGMPTRWYIFTLRRGDLRGQHWFCRRRCPRERIPCLPWPLGTPDFHHIYVAGDLHVRGARDSPCTYPSPPKGRYRSTSSHHATAEGNCRCARYDFSLRSNSDDCHRTLKQAPT